MKIFLTRWYGVILALIVISILVFGGGPESKQCESAHIRLGFYESCLDIPSR